jgi:hypothetical protein
MCALAGRIANIESRTFEPEPDESISSSRFYKVQISKCQFDTTILHIPWLRRQQLKNLFCIATANIALKVDELLLELTISSKVNGNDSITYYG